MRYIDPDGRFIIDPNATKEQRAIIQRAINMAKMLLQDKKVLQAMMSKGHLSRSQIMNDFTDGKGPVLTLSKDLFGRAFGQYTPNGKGSGKFEINAVTTDNASEFSEDSQLNVIFLLASTIMHEDVHRGNDAAGFNEHEEGVEQGEAFEEQAFGESVQYSNSEEIRTRFNSHFKKVVNSKIFDANFKAKNEWKKYEEKKVNDKIDIKKRKEENILKSKK
ncbi:hypothetical protein [Chryseobacterium chendengshani]|uniref:hypothetical protein n=1 Tax=Chryseobacterium sp. LJ668 TaxID=2864040 RepID=UPI0038CFF0D3